VFIKLTMYTPHLMHEVCEPIHARGACVCSSSLLYTHTNTHKHTHTHTHTHLPTYPHKHTITHTHTHTNKHTQRPHLMHKCVELVHVFCSGPLQPATEAGV